MLVEDVEIDASIAARDIRRRLRFKRMPNLVQSQVRLLPESSEAGFLRPDTGSLIQPYLLPMAAALSLNAPSIDESFRSGSPPCILCLGVGGGALLTSLRSHFGFHVLGIEADDAVLSVATRHFGLAKDESLQLLTCDGIELIAGYAQERPPSRLFHAIMVDLDGEDPMKGAIAPTAEFLHRSVLLGAKLALHEHGILVINVISSGEAFYKRMIKLFRKFFCELYQIQVGNGENRVLVAAVSPVGFVAEELKQQGHLYEKLKELGCERFIDAIEKV
ncbi:hypothetical protein HPP92_005150 [Vanilla planifolia]|uniref:Methyltransferase-like protein 13 n=1 Tax=Vanilla planifolia TaxID=51239 RepID=A0A835VF39_VANPL|nr:hypothetical protein HPP92_005150 [Vanilla planifolia]